MGNCCPRSRSQEAGGSSELSEKELVIINDTTRTIGLRDREREVYGVLRYKIGPGGREKVSVDLRDAGTYYRMAVLVMVDERDENRVEPTHPPLFIDTEDLHTQKVITISVRDNKYVLDKESRASHSKSSRNNGNSKRNS